MRYPILVLAVAAVLLPTSLAHADSWGPYQARVHADHTGLYRVYIAPGGTSFIFFKAANPSPIPGGVKYENAGRGRGRTVEDDAPDSREKLRPATNDIVLARGKLENPPLNVVVDHRGHGFLAIDRYLRAGYDVIFSVVNAAGETEYTADLDGMFEGEPHTWNHTVSSRWWFRSAWIEPSGDGVILVANPKDGGRAIRRVDLETHEVRSATDDEISRGTLHPDPTVRALAFDLASEYGCPIDPVRLSHLLEDAATPTAVRLRAAVALTEQTGTPHGLELFESVLSSSRDLTEQPEESAYALSRLTTIAGMDALPTLLEVGAQISGQQFMLRAAVVEGLAKLGSQATPKLVEVLESNEPGTMTAIAVDALEQIADPTSVPALLACVRTWTAEWPANRALNVAIGIAGETIADELVTLLHMGTTQDGRIAMYFKNVRHDSALAALRDARRRHSGGTKEARWIDEAIAVQLGTHEGADPETTPKSPKR